MARQQESEGRATDIYFVKNNVLVHVISYGDSPNQLQFVRDVARRIEAKIEAVLPKNEHETPKKLGPLEK